MKESAENYLETILVLESSLEKVRSIDIVKATGYSKPSISVAMKKLKQAGLIDIDTDGYIYLSESGRKEASYILERHTILVDAFLEMGISLEVAEEDACRVEHVISEETFTKLKEYFTKRKN